MTDHHESLRKVIQHGLLSDIFRFDRAVALLRTIGDQSATINHGSRGYAQLFHALGVALNTEAVLAASRLYDVPTKKYPIRCLRAALDYVSRHKDTFSIIAEPHQLKQCLRAIEVPVEVTCIVDTQPGMFAGIFTDYMLQRLDGAAVSEATERLKNLRDKGLAHNEDVELISGPTWGAIFQLITLAKHTVATLGWAYLSMMWAVDGRYVLEEDAQKPALVLENLLELLYSQHSIDAVHQRQYPNIKR